MTHDSNAPIAGIYHAQWCECPFSSMNCFVHSKRSDGSHQYSGSSQEKSCSFYIVQINYKTASANLPTNWQRMLIRCILQKYTVGKLQSKQQKTNCRSTYSFSEAVRESIGCISSTGELIQVALPDWQMINQEQAKKFIKKKSDFSYEII